MWLKQGVPEGTHADREHNKTFSGKIDRSKYKYPVLLTVSDNCLFISINTSNGFISTPIDYNVSRFEFDLNVKNVTLRYDRWRDMVQNGVYFTHNSL